MDSQRTPERIQTLIIGGGQAGLSAGYHLKRQGLPLLILDANARTGDSWRERWDSLRLFTPARYNSLDGMPFPAKGWSFPTKDEMANYLEAYAKHFELPVRHGVRVTKLSRAGNGFLVEAADERFEAENVVVAIGHYQQPKVPAFGGELDRGIVQLHSSEYRNPAQLQEGGVLLVGAGNSGAEIAAELIRTHPVWMSGPSTGEIPFRTDGLAGRLLLTRLVLGVVFRHVLTIRTPLGRRMRPKALKQAGPLIRVKSRDLQRAGVLRTGRTVGVQDGRPLLDDGRVLDVRNVIWCTGYHAGLSWIDMPVFGEHEPLHRRGVVESVPGLYFTGLPFQYAMSSGMVQGAGRDAAYVAKAVGQRIRKAASAPVETPGPSPALAGHGYLTD
jgi:putative flavoprotein involved in K+ transport